MTDSAIEMRDPPAPIQAGDWFGTLRVVTWSPGERIELVWPGQSRAMAVLAMLWGIPPGIVLALGAWLVPAPYCWGLLPFALAVPPLVCLWWDWRFQRTRRFVFDWHSGQVAWTLGNCTTCAALSEITSVALHGLRITGSFQRQTHRERGEYSSYLVLRIGRRSLRMTHALEQLWEDEAEPYRRLRMLQSELSTALNLTPGAPADYRGGGIKWAILRIRHPALPLLDPQAAAAV